MRFTLRLTWILILGLTVICIAASWYQERMQQRALQRSIEGQSKVTAEALRTVIEPLLMQQTSASRLREVVESFQSDTTDQRIALYGAGGKPIAPSSATAPDETAARQLIAEAIRRNAPQVAFKDLGSGNVHALALPLHDRKSVVGALLVTYDSAAFQQRKLRIWRRMLFTLLLEIAAIALIIGFVVRRSIAAPIVKVTRWLQAVRMGTASHEIPETGDQLWDPFANEVQQIANSLTLARASAEREASLRHAADSLWTHERLSASVRGALDGSRLVVVSNREPYMHRWNRGEIEAIVPASGLVTALEPILTACNGTWVAHGSGDADRETADSHDRIAVPPERPQYTLRRVWLEKEEEDGYYYGFANEGLWPLCHIAHTRPIFRSADWESYKRVNAKFAEAVNDEIRDIPRPIVFVQDYHFALLPRMLKHLRPDARVAVFWHIPWPNPEAFGICPWQSELLHGLLGADLLGFHVQAHCHNFMHTVDRALECRIDWASMAAIQGGHQTHVKPFPISVDYETLSRTADGEPRIYLTRQPEVLKKLETEAMFLGVGVDRVDYTKGIPERFQGVERFLQKYPAYQGKFTFVQVGAPSRTHIPRYENLLRQVEEEAERINARFATSKWKPIVFLARHHSRAEIEVLYKTADLCLVTSLHDGMNLVAKEFIASRNDHDGMLILSQFAGAAEELADSLIVNPYDVDDVAEAIRVALEMRPEERRARMVRLRRAVEQHNVFHWAGMLIEELTGIRSEDERSSMKAVG